MKPIDHYLVGLEALGAAERAASSKTSSVGGSPTTRNIVVTLSALASAHFDAARAAVAIVGPYGDTETVAVAAQASEAARRHE